VRNIVILRPEPGASATFGRAVERGLSPVKLPLFSIEPLPWSPPDDLSEFDGLLVTSANAIRAAGEGLDRLKPLPVYAVGPASAAAAAEAGFDVAKVGAARVGALLKSIDPDLRLLHLAGEDRIDPRRVWQKITVVPIYRAKAIEQIDAAPVEGSVVLVHSPRAGARLAEIVTNRAGVAVAAISREAAQACGDGWESVSALQRPSDIGLLALAARLCERTDE
jgi:uroporphyrinogen-III synthase